MSNPPVKIFDKAGNPITSTSSGTKRLLDVNAFSVDPNNPTRIAEFDNVFKIPVSIDISHHEVHEGNAFWVSNNATLGNGNINTVSIQTPNTSKRLHLLLRIDSSAEALFDVLEDVTSLASGAAITPKNFDRNSGNVSVASSKVGDTIGADAIVPTGGTAIWTETLGVKGIVTSRENASELILKQNSIYLFRITNGATANNCTILLSWYEYTPE
ncbi:MAG: hypothetical protein KKE05_04305 [Nanoarchaeota archaeon]|nr:hypothetical protein [Nanoarchaeota archaeon]